MTSEAPSVLVAEGTERAVVATCRGLDLAGYRVSAVARTRAAPALWSRACNQTFLAAEPKEDGASFVARIEHLITRSRYDVLLPGGDASLMLLSAHRAALEPNVRLGLPPEDVVARALSKVAFLDDTTAAGIPAPTSIVCEESRDARAAATALGFPVIVKPTRSIRPAGAELRQEKVIVVEEPAGLERALVLVRAPWIVQRFFPGRPCYSCAGVFADGRLLALAVARYIRTWPPAAGATTYAETVTPPAGLVDGVERLLGRIGWAGIFEVELLDLGDGRFAAVDLNPRVFGWMALAIGAGANLPAVWCDWLLGRTRRPAIAVPGVSYRWEDGDACHLAWQLVHGHFAAAAAVLAPHRGVVHAFGSWRDPAPLPVRLVHVTARTFLRVLPSRQTRNGGSGREGARS